MRKWIARMADWRPAASPSHAESLAPGRKTATPIIRQRDHSGGAFAAFCDAIRKLNRCRALFGHSDSFLRFAISAVILFSPLYLL